jgi:hypothetical protein
VPRKVALVGTSTSTSRDAPFGDESWEIWGMPYDATLDRMDYLFEIHREWKTDGEYPNASPRTDCAESRIGYINFLETPCYFLAEEPDVPLGIKYPLAEVAEAIQCPGS